MKIIVTREAAERLLSQVHYIRDQHAPAAAERLYDRVHQFLDLHLSHFPRLGRKLPDREIWEVRIPKTKLIAWYRIHEDYVAVLTFWHSAQDRFAQTE